MNELFVKATRKKLRFQTEKGLLTVEDLWDLPLTVLDRLAVSLKKQLEESDGLSFISKKPAGSCELELRFNIAKHIIEVRLAEAEAKKLAVEKREKREKILAIIEQKENEGLANADIADLRKMLNDLEQ